MSKKNDVSAFKMDAGSKNILNGKTGKQKLGRPNATEKRTFKVTLSFTEAEGEIIAHKAGLVNHATFIMAKVKETDLLK